MNRIRFRSILLTGVLVLMVGALWLYFAPSQIGGSTSYVVTHGVSMEPSFHSGDLALVRPAAQYKVGEIVAYQSSVLHEVVLHRIVAIDSGHYTFKGDNNHFLDPVHPTRAAIVGKLWLHIPQGGVTLAYLHSPVVVAVLCAGLGLVLMVGVGETRRRGRRRARPGPGSGLPGGAAVSAKQLDSHNLRTLLIAAGTVAVFFLGLVVLAFSRPANRPATQSIRYTQLVSFGYHARAHAGPVYPDGVITTGDPIFLQLVHRLGVDFHYRLLSAGPAVLHGTDQAVLKLSGQTGWTRTIALTPTRRFTGDQVRGSVSLDLSSLQALLGQIEQQTGIPSAGYTIAVEANVHVRGRLAGRPVNTGFNGQLPFTLGPMQLLVGAGGSAGSGSAGTGSSASAGTSSTGPAGTGSSASASGLNSSQPGKLEVTSMAPSAITVLGVSFGVAALRLLAPVGFLIALASAMALAALLARSPAFGEAHRIQAKYGHMIVPINAGADLGWPAIDVGNIKALARLAEASGQLILHNHGDDADTFLVNDEGSVYRYQVQLPKIVWGEWSTPEANALAASLDAQAAGGEGGADSQAGHVPLGT